MPDPAATHADARTTPTKLDLKKAERLDVQWQDGAACSYPLSLLRSRCPCAMCKTVRQEQQVRRPTTLNILPGNYAEPLSVLSAELVGNYALKIEWSDRHGSGIYSFAYLRELCPPTPPLTGVAASAAIGGG